MYCRHRRRQARDMYHFVGQLFFLFLVSSHVLLFLYSISFSTHERRDEVRSKIVLDMTTEVHVSDLCNPCRNFFKTNF